MLSTKNVDKSKLLRVKKMIPQEAEHSCWHMKPAGFLSPGCSAFRPAGLSV